MSETFNLRSFVGNQVEKLSTPKNILVDKFRQTVDSIRFPFSSINNNNNSNTEKGTAASSTTTEQLSNTHPSESLSTSSVSSLTSNHPLLNFRMIATNPQYSSPSMKTFTNRLSMRHSSLKRHVSESNKSDETTIARPIYHDNPPVNVDTLLNKTIPENLPKTDRSRSLIRQSTDATCTFPIRRPIRRLESVEIPGLNGVKSIRYISDDLGRLEPHLYKKQVSHNNSTHDTGQISLTLFYNQPLTSLIITILSIDHLPCRNSSSKTLPNPFIKLTLLPDRRKKFQTKPSKHTQSTQLNETFQFQISYEQLHQRILLLSVYDFRRSSKRNLIGTVKIDDICSIPDITSNEISFTKNILPGMEVSFALISLETSLHTSEECH